MNLFKKLFLVVMVAGLTTACNDSSDSPTEEKLDSLNERKDSLTKNVDSAFDNKIDSLQQKKEKLKDKFDSSIEAKKDSVKGKKS